MPPFSIGVGLRQRVHTRRNLRSERGNFEEPLLDVRTGRGPVVHHVCLCPVEESEERPRRASLGKLYAVTKNIRERTIVVP